MWRGWLLWCVILGPSLGVNPQHHVGVLLSDRGVITARGRVGGCCVSSLAQSF